MIVDFIPVSASDDNLEVGAEVGEGNSSGPSDPTRSTEHQHPRIPCLLWELDPRTSLGIGRTGHTNDCRASSSELQMQWWWEWNSSRHNLTLYERLYSTLCQQHPISFVLSFQFSCLRSRRGTFWCLIPSLIYFFYGGDLSFTALTYWG